MNIIELKGVSEKFKLYTHGRKSIKERILSILHGRKNVFKEFLALRNINLTIEEGEVVGIIGENGSGKTTLLKLITGILPPDKGSVDVRGRVSSLLELGAAFHPELTGRENIYLNGAVLGLSKSEIDSRFKDIVRFSELENFIDSPLKTYSAGMHVRLGFAIAINVEPDILLIDEVLVVGDETFQRKCLQKIKEFKEQGKTIVFVSHSMDIVNRLCERAILLREGEIIKDGPADKVTSLYMQTVGDKKGIGIMKKGSLDVIFNNGKCILCWGGKILTKDLAGCVSLKAGNSWYISTQAEWEIQTQGQDGIVAFGRWIDLPLCQEWRINLENNNSVRWEIKMNADDDIKLMDRHITFMLSDKYKRWITPFKEGDFPEEFHSSKWENVLVDNKNTHCIGVKEISEDSKYMPSIILDFPEEETKVLPFILNSNFSIQARVLQAQAVKKEEIIRPGSYQFFTGTIFIYDKQSDMDKHLNRIAKKKTLELERKAQQHALEKARQLKEEMQRHTIESGNLKIILKDGKCRIFYKGIELTKELGVYTYICSSGNWYGSDIAKWSIEKIDSTKIIATGKWTKVPMSQIWYIDLREANCIDLKIELELGKELEIDRKQVEIMVPDRYNRWIYSEEEGRFPEILINDEGCEEIVMRKKVGVNKIIGVREELYQGMEFLPSIIFDFSSSKSVTTPVILNTGYGVSARILRLEMIELSKMLSAGRHFIFSGKIFLNLPSNIIDSYISQKTQEKSIEQGDIRLIFTGGKGKLFWRDIELTKSMGLYTSLRSQGVWHDSTAHAVWEIKEINKTTMIVRGKWRKLPISQLWKLQLKEGNTIFWEVEMQLNGEIKLEREQANIMLTDAYINWSANNQKGAFPEEFSEDYGGDWESMWKGSPKMSPISIDSVQGGNLFLPSVVLDCSLQDDTYIANIVNSDRMFKGRVLQCLRINEGNKINFAPCSYRYFSGTIKIKDI